MEEALPAPEESIVPEKPTIPFHSFMVQYCIKLSSYLLATSSKVIVVSESETVLTVLVLSGSSKMYRSDV